MQSPDWKFFNALFEIINEDQLQYKCKNGKTIFENFAKIITLALTNSEKVEKDQKDKPKLMTQVK